MPTQIQATNGDVFHLWQLGDMSAPEPVDEHSFTTIDNEMCAGYRSTSLLGSDTGLREWQLDLPTLAGSTVIPAAVTDPYSATVSRAQYLRNLYRYNRTTGEPFGYRWPPETGNYYLADFADGGLSMTKKKGVDIWSAKVHLKQRRINNVSVFDPAYIFSLDTYTPAIWLLGADFVDDTPDIWANHFPLGLFSFSGTGDTVKVSSAQNGQDIVRFSNTTNSGVLTETGATFKEVFLAMKMREGTFSNNAGIITDTGAAGTQVLTGASGTGLFTNPALSTTAFEYRYNGDVKAQNAMTAPMNTWGIVHLRYTTGWTLASGFQIGKNRTTAGTFAEMDLGEMLVFTSVLSVINAREVTEYLGCRWGVEL